MNLHIFFRSLFLQKVQNVQTFALLRCKKFSTALLMLHHQNREVKAEY